MKTHSRFISILLILVLVLGLIAGCSKNKADDPQPVDSQDPPVQDPIDEEETTEEFVFNPSEGIDKDGHWEGIRASDYVELGEYIGITIPKEVHEVSQEAMDYEIEALISYFITSEKRYEGIIKDGDTVHMDYIGSIDGVEFEGGNTNGNGAAVVIGETQYIDDFLEQLIGHSPGDNFDVEVTFPEDYHKEELGGKDAVFDVTINYIIETVTPEWTDEFISENLAENYGAQTTAEMEDYIRDTLSSIDTAEYVEQYLLENNTVDNIPEAMISYQQGFVIDHFAMQATKNGLSVDDYLKKAANLESTEALVELYAKEIALEAQEDLVVQAIAEDASIEVTAEDVTAYFKDYVGVDDFSEYEAEYGMPYLKMTILKQLVLNHMIDNAILQ